MTNKLVKKTNHCLICGSLKLTKYLSLGTQALANAYVTKQNLLKPEFKTPLDVYFCHQCRLAQLLDIVNRDFLFQNYAYFSSTSPQLHAHFDQYAQEVSKQFPHQVKKLVFEIASNDGLLLKKFKNRGANILGIDPAQNIADFANKQGIETIPKFFTSNIAHDICEEHGKAGIIAANNVLAHTDILHDIILGIKKLLDKDGVFVFEVQYISDLLQHNEFDNTYHEHICYFSLFPLRYLLNKYDLEIFNVKHIDTQGGSIRVYATHKPSIYSIKNSVKQFLDKEKKQKLNSVNTYLQFGKKPIKIKNGLTKILKDLKRKRKKIAGYGAAAKGNTLLQYCEIGPEIIDYITDNAPSKQGKYTPGMHIPIVSPKQIKQDTPVYILILAWNYAKSIMKQEKWFLDQGGKFIIPIPKPKIIENLWL